MRTIPSALQAKLDSGVTTLCRCWIIRRQTARSRASPTTTTTSCSAKSRARRERVVASEATQKLGLAVQSSEIAGALTDDSLNEADLAAGRYDAAASRCGSSIGAIPLSVLLAKGVLGEVRREGAAFAAELRSLAHRLGETSGRLYTATCTADLGDARCTVDLTGAAFHGSGTVTAVPGAGILVASGLDSFDDGWFTAGKLTFTAGANDGLRSRGEDAPRRCDAGSRLSCGSRCRSRSCRRHVHGHRWLRQALRHLPRAFRQRGQFSRLPAHSRQRFRGELSQHRRARPRRRQAGRMMDRPHRHRRRGARLRIGTPYRHQASLKGVGCDCLGLVRGVWRAVHGRGARAGAGLTRPTGRRRPGAKLLPKPGGILSRGWRVRARSRPATCCCSAGAPAWRPSTPRSSPHARSRPAP